MIGNQIAAGIGTVGIANDSFNGTGSATTFTLSKTVGAATDIEVLVDNVQQSPYDSSYSVSGTTLTFSTAPPAGTNNVYVIYNQARLSVSNQVVPDDGSITETKLAAAAVTPAKMHSTLDLSGKTLTMPAGHQVGLQSMSSQLSYQEVSSTSYVEVTGMNVMITPKSTSSKIKVSAQISWWLTTDANNYMFLSFFRSIGGGSFSNMGTTSPYYAQQFYHPGRNATYNLAAHLTMVDQPSTSSAVEYKLYCRRYDATNNIRLKYAQTLSVMTAEESTA